MPLYEYECKKCGRRMEKIRKFSDPPLTTCESCGGKLEQLLSSPAIQFKGAGWYVTDYAKKPPGAGQSADSAAAADKKDSAAPKNEEKSSAKPSEPVKTDSGKD